MFGNIPWNEYVRARAFLTHEEVNVLQRTEEASLDIALGDQVCPLDRASSCPPPPEANGARQENPPAGDLVV